MPTRVPGVRAFRSGFQARIQVNGTPVSRLFASYDEAVAWRNTQAELALRGKCSPVAAQRTSFAEHWEIWRTSVVRRDNTLAQYDSTYRTYLEPAWGRIPVGRITRRAAQAWVKELINYKDEHDRGLSASRIIRCVAIASVCLQVLVDDEILDRNPFRRLDVPALPDERSS
jgi:hypothetical protein